LKVKFLKELRTANLKSEFTGSYKKGMLLFISANHKNKPELE